MKRRGFILAGGTIGLSAVAGCTGSDGEGTGGTTTEAPTTRPSDTETTSEGEGTTTGGGGTETTADEETATTADRDDGTATDEGTETTTEGETPDVTFGTLYLMPNNYRFEAEYSDPDEDVSGTVTGRYHGSDYYQRIEPDSTDDVFEIYHVDGDDYVVLNETQCFVNPGPAAKPDSGTEGDAEEYGSKPDAGLRPSGTTTIDGETVYVFEVTGEDVEGKWTLYVTASTGYLRRAESEDVTIDFYDWGEVDQISIPEECED
ncbi:MAG: hypothetical protein ACI9YT_000205 [Halobacteriales archaeon]|jgi:hypothetical protein